MEFRKYEKIHRLGKEETDGILFGDIHVMEKIDGANLSIWVGEDMNIHIGSRTREITEGFNGAVDYVREHPGIKKLLLENPTYRLYGEWLVKHTISYKETSYKKFYLFDIRTENGFMDPEIVVAIAKEYGIDHAHYHGKFRNPSYEEVEKLAGQSILGDKGEGVVIKNMDFVNKFGDLCYAKIVTEQFTEDNSVVFGGNNRNAFNYWEIYVSNKYITLERVRKIMQKTQPLVDERLDMKHIPRICNSVYHDMLTEEIWEIQKNVPVINLKVLQRVCFKKAKAIYLDILRDDLSVAYK